MASSSSATKEEVFGSLSEDEFNHDSGPLPGPGTLPRRGIAEHPANAGADDRWRHTPSRGRGLGPGDRRHRICPCGCPRPVSHRGTHLITWNTSGIAWVNLQQVSVQMVDRRDRYGWETLRRGRDGDTSTSFTDNEQANGRKFVYRIMTANTLGRSHHARHLRLALGQPPPERRRRPGGHRHTAGEDQANTRGVPGGDGSIPGNTPAGRAIGAPSRPPTPTTTSSSTAWAGPTEPASTLMRSPASCGPRPRWPAAAGRATASGCRSATAWMTSATRRIPR